MARGRCLLTSRPVLLAFAVFVVLGGSNAAAVKAVLGEMPPFWSAGLRFVIAGVLLLVVMAVQRRPVPRGDRLLGTVLFSGAVLFQEPVQPSFLLGGAVALVGVYVGAIYRPTARAEEHEPDATTAEA